MANVQLRKPVKKTNQISTTSVTFESAQLHIQDIYMFTFSLNILWGLKLKNNLNVFRTFHTFSCRTVFSFQTLSWATRILQETSESARNLGSGRIRQVCLKCKILARFLQIVSDLYHFCKILARNVWEFDWGKNFANIGFYLI